MLRKTENGELIRKTVVKLSTLYCVLCTNDKTLHYTLSFRLRRKSIIVRHYTFPFPRASHWRFVTRLTKGFLRRI